MKNIPQFILSLITTTGLISLVFCLLKLEILPANQRIIDMIVGSLITMWVQQQGFWFNSTASSKEKDEALTAIAKMPVSSSGTGIGGRSNDIPSNIPAKDVSVVAEGDVTVEKAKKNT